MMGIDSCGMLLGAIHEEKREEKLHLLMVDDHIPAGAKLYRAGYVPLWIRNALLGRAPS